jgi:hypothetical protein
VFWHLCDQRRWPFTLHSCGEEVWRMLRWRFWSWGQVWWLVACTASTGDAATRAVEALGSRAEAFPDKRVPVLECGADHNQLVLPCDARGSGRTASAVCNRTRWHCQVRLRQYGVWCREVLQHTLLPHRVHGRLREESVTLRCLGCVQWSVWEYRRCSLTSPMSQT